MSKAKFLWLAAPALFLLAGCGQVITRALPTPAPSPTVALTQVATLRPTATPAPYTPAPTATPTATPTPIIYRIQRGDTLLAIALQFGVSVRDLQDTNGITDPRTLQVGQELIIPQVEPEIAGTPTPLPTPLPFKVDNVSFHYTPIGGLWCFGEVLNTTGSELEQVAVRITLLDENGKALAQMEQPIETEIIAPGAKASFAAHFSTPPRSFASYSVVPARGIRGYVGLYYRDLKVQDVAGQGERYATYTVSGKIVNIGPEDANGVVVMVTLYDALGRVIATRRSPPEHNVIPRGGQTSFMVVLTPIGGPVESYVVQALGRRLPTPTPPPR